MRAAVCQMRSGDDVPANLAAAQALLTEAADAGTDIAMLPEFFAYLGPDSRIPEVAETLPGGSGIDDAVHGGPGTADVDPRREHPRARR